jgi:stage II sporulation protein D
MCTEGKIQEMLLEEYLKGVIAAEMPADFEMEALKAQAVAARTYAFARIKQLFSAPEDRHGGADICTDSRCCQAWIPKNTAVKKWGALSSIKNWSKIERAVAETQGVIITYNGRIANPVFHANSGGRTENAEDVWAGGAVPYLKSVVSYGEDISAGYESTVLVKDEEVVVALKKEYPDIKLNQKDIIKDINIQDHTAGGRVKDIRVGNIVIKGTDFRRVLNLRSANFTIERESPGTLAVTCTGHGHGVGMSQWGANYLAQSGEDYEKILKYYYTGIELDSIEIYEERQ